MNSNEAFDRWHARHTHDDGKLKTRDKAIVAAINHALESLLINPNTFVTPCEIQNWMLQNLGFGEDVVTLDRILEHCLYLTGEHGTKTKQFSQPLKNPKLRKSELFALVDGAASYSYREISHRSK